ncbi:MAG: low molecular weight phosphotyrosine protein phosphatase [Gammaproteobacteria bacterium]|nr:low molecular weight phosphotyrosine protein phosphatase [Gammaproteobacteria bacterium]
MKVLFVCLGNICRSPSAEAVMRSLVATSKLDMQIDSAGTAAYHIGKTPDERSQAAALERGISMQGQFARQVSQDDFYEFDYIFAMDRSNLADLESVRPANGSAQLRLFLKEYGSMGYEEVPDPYYGGQKGFELVLDLLQDACQAFLSEKLKE